MKMSRFLSVVSAGMVAVALTACGGGGGSSAPTGGTGAVDTSFTIASTVVANGGTLPLEHACAKDGGLEIPPSFYWKNVPKDTGSYVLNIELTGQGDQVYPVPGVYRNLYNIDGGVLSIPASTDLVGLGDNVTQHINSNWSHLSGSVPCRYFKVLGTPNPVQHFRVTILALSKDMPKPVVVLGSATMPQIDTVVDSSLFGGKAPGLLDTVVVDNADPALVKRVKDYVVGRATMTFDY